jgi:ABC-type branched-subunit amino acid transport system permease subunit
VGSNLGPIIGAVLVPVVLAEGSRYLPQFGPPTLVPSLEWIAIGVVLLAFLWFWPRGILPERKHTFPPTPASRPLAMPSTRSLSVSSLKRESRPSR